jgi:hypothetical protein
MDQNMDDRLDRLFAAARDEPGDTAGAEEFFETRLMARLRERREAQKPWYELAWRCVPAFGMVTVVMVVCSITIGWSAPTDLFAAISAPQEESLSGSFISGE